MTRIELDEGVLRYESDEEEEVFAQARASDENHRSWQLSAFSWLLALGLVSAGLVWAGAFDLRGGWPGLIVPGLLITIGSVGRSWAVFGMGTPGIRNDGVVVNSLSNRGIAGVAVGLALTAFYLALYFDWPQGLLAGGVTMIRPVASIFQREAVDKYFLYSFLYSFAVLVFGARMAIRYRHNRYQVVRTASVVFFQLGFAFLIPQLLRALDEPEFYPSYFWPLMADAMFPDTVQGLLSHPGKLGGFMVIWGGLMTIVATPILTYRFGKRWYCSWVCGCGALAETMGDPFRHLSDKSRRAWRIERAMIYSVLAVVIALTMALWIAPGSFSGSFRMIYGLIVTSTFAGVVGVGFYPILGSRVWCRFGCPMAAYLGLLQRFLSRFRITTNGGQCISCGNCSTYCEMGIDVRSYAQRGESIVRASCVGCGICASVCPRGVLKLESGPIKISGEAVSRHED